MNIIIVILLSILFGLISSYLVKSAKQSGDYFQNLIEKEKNSQHNR